MAQLLVRALDRERRGTTYFPADLIHLYALTDVLEALHAPIDSSVTHDVCSALVEEIVARGNKNYSHLAISGRILATTAARWLGTNAVPFVCARSSGSVGGTRKPARKLSDDSGAVGHALAVLALQIPGATNARLVGLSVSLLDGIPEPSAPGQSEAQTRITVRRVCALLDDEDLAGMLKWPFCASEAQKLVLTD